MGWGGSKRPLLRAVALAVLLVAGTAVPGGAASGAVPGRAAPGGAAVVVGPTHPPSPSATSPSDGPRPSPSRTGPSDDPTPPEPPADPHLTLSPEVVELPRQAPATVTARGTGFDCAPEQRGRAGQLTLSIEGQASVSLPVGDEGTFTDSIAVPPETAPGTYTVRARCIGGPPERQASFRVVVARPLLDPHIRLSTNRGKPGAPVGVTGSGFLCDGAVRVLWDGQPVASADPAASGGFTTRLTVPSGATEGRHEVSATCASPDGVRDSEPFTVEPSGPSGPSGPPGRTSEVTIHMTDYPTSCTWGSIVVGGKALPTRLDDDSTQGGAEKGRWEFIDLHAQVPGEVKGHKPVDLDCPGRSREHAGEMDLPAELLATFYLPNGTPHRSEQKTGAIRKPPLRSTPPPPSPTPTDTGSSPSPSDSGGSPSPSGSRSPGAPTEPPGHGGKDDDEHRALGLVEALRTPSDVSWALKDLAGSAGMAAWFLVLVLLLEKAFPPHLAENAISRWWRLRRRRTSTDGSPPSPPRAARLPGWIRMGCYAVLGGALECWADADTTMTAVSALKALGAALGVLVILVTYEKTKDTLLRPGRGGVRAELRVVPAGIALALVMALFSRALELPVPYVYGLVAVYTLLGEPPRREPDAQPSGVPPGQAVLLGGVCVLAASLAVWILSEPRVEAAREAPADSVTYVIGYALGLAVIAGVQVVVFGLLPLSGMDGRTLKSWSKPAWYGLYLVALVFFFHVTLNTVHPGTGPGPEVSEDLRWRTLGIATAAFLGAWLLSIALRRAVARAELRAAAS